jgi:4-amino-4-deoxy-L-arabinose transferase-like glycosyltransferase
MDSEAGSKAIATADTTPAWRDTLALLLVFGALYFFVLGSHPLSNPDEGRYAEIPREMVASGEWVLPQLNGVAYFEKPPFVYWANAAAFTLFGQGEWSARCVPVLFALGGLLLTYGAGRSLYGRPTGLAAACVLGTSLLYFALLRILILDMVVSVLMSATLFCFVLGVREAPGRARRLLFYGLYASSALATLSKGLIGFLLTGAVMFLWLLIFNQWRRLRPFYLPTGALLFLALALPWHLLAASRHEEWVRFYLVQEHWLRFTTKMHSRFGPWWYFIPVVLAGFFPWIGYLFTAAREQFCGAWARRKAEADTWFLILWAVFIFLFFSRSQSKLIPYILPIFPALAVLTGAWLVRVLEQGRVAALRTGRVVFYFGCGFFAVAALTVVLRPELLKDPAEILEARPYLAVMAAVLFLGALATWRLHATRGARAGLLAQGATMAAFLTSLALTYPQVPSRNTKDLAGIVKARATASDLIYHYHCFAHDFLFYTGRVVGTVDHIDELGLGIDPVARASGRFIDEAEFRRQWAGPRRIWALARIGDEAQKLFADPAFKVHVIASNARYTLFSNQP